MRRSEAHLEISGLFIGLALVVVPSMFMWPMPDRLGVGGSVAFFVAGWLCFVASRFASASVFARAVIMGIGIGIIFVGGIGATSVFLEVVGVTS